MYGVLLSGWCFALCSLTRLCFIQWILSFFVCTRSTVLSLSTFTYISSSFFAYALFFTFNKLLSHLIVPIPPFYGSVSRDKVCLHLRCVQQPNFVELAAREVSLILATVEVSDVQELFAEFQERGVEFTQTPAKQPWGGTDFHVRDPDGNVISFATYE